MDISLFGKNIFKHSSRDKGLVWCFWIDWVLYLDWRASFSKFNPFFGLDNEYLNNEKYYDNLFIIN